MSLGLDLSGRYNINFGHFFLTNQRGGFICCNVQLLKRLVLPRALEALSTHNLIQGHMYCTIEGFCPTARGIQ